MKKRITAIVTAAVLLMALAGCASGNEQNDQLALQSNGPVQQDTVPETPGTHADTGIMALHQAKAIALAHAGVTEEQISGLKEEYDEDDGVKSYEIEFIHDGVEYEYDIHAVSGDIIKSEKDGADNRTPVDGQLLTEEQAKAIALAHAGVAEADASFLRAEFDVDDGVSSYEIEFVAGGAEYEYDIHAITGAVLKYEKEGGSHSTGGTAETTRLTAEEAKTIAFNHAGVAAGSVYDLEVELDRDDGTEHYEISFECGGVEYEYEIHAYSGKILKAEKDHD